MEQKIDLDIVITPEVRNKVRVYSIHSIQVPNVVTQGETIEDAKKMLKEALTLYFKDMPEEKERFGCLGKEGCTTPLISRLAI